MYTFYNDGRVQKLVAQSYESGKITAATNFIVQRAFAAQAVRDGNLITGQQQYSGTAAAELIIDAFGR
jgi:hypothetical protein